MLALLACACILALPPAPVLAAYINGQGTLIDGPLQVTPDAGPDRWIGREPVSVPVYLRVVRSDGTTTTTTVQIRLSPGWG